MAVQLQQLLALADAHADLIWIVGLSDIVPYHLQCLQSSLTVLIRFGLLL